MLQNEGGIYMFELEKNPGLKANVISMYKSRFQSEGFLDLGLQRMRQSLEN